MVEAIVTLFLVCLVVFRSILESDLGFHNYMDRFDLLLYLEEDQMRVDIKRYNKDDVSMVRDHENKRLLVLEVSGKALLPIIKACIKCCLWRMNFKVERHKAHPNPMLALLPAS